MRKIGVLWGILAGLLTGLQAQTPEKRPEPASVTLENLRENVFQVRGGRGATGGVILEEEEVWVIDSKMTEDSSRETLEKIRQLTPHPIAFILLTHSDGDHVNGLTAFPPRVPIIAHKHTREDMEKAFLDPRQKAFLPGITITEKIVLHGKRTKAELLHFGPAHTDGDIVVFFPKEKVAFVGDLVFTERDPLIHRSKNGNSFGLARTLRALLSLDAELFVPGHGPIATKSDIQAILHALEEKQARVRSLVEEGKTLEEVKKAFSIEEDTSAASDRRWPSLVEIIYQELTEKK